MNVLSPPPENECERCGKAMETSYGVEYRYCEQCQQVIDRRQA